MSQYKDVPGYEGLYKVSDDGIVLNSKGYRLKYFDNHGYNRVSLCKNGVYSHFVVHRLVYSAFNNFPLDNYGKLQIDHINGIRNDNRIENLRLVSAKENMNNPNTRYKLAGENNPFYGKRHSDDLLRKIALKNSIPVNQLTLQGEFVKRWDSFSDAADFYRVHPSNMVRCAKGKIHTSCGYKWEYA